jgi:hypothetical protein
MASEPWPELPYEAWKDTYATLHMWTQIVGKVALALAPPLNHSWAIAMHLTPRGLSTRTLPHGTRAFTAEFDFIDHKLVIRASDGLVRSTDLKPRSVADFYREVMSMLAGMGLPVRIWPVSAETPTPIRLDQDEAHHSYDPEFANRVWRILALSEGPLTDSRCRFVGKASPVHFFWGSFDLAVTRFSGRPAPPREGPAFMQEAYSHEVISHGFWPGAEILPEPVYYAYAAPEPPGFGDAKVMPEAASYNKALGGEFILPYEAVRRATDPARELRMFVESTYELGAALAGWDRKALERHPAAVGADASKAAR